MSLHTNSKVYQKKILTQLKQREEFTLYDTSTSMFSSYIFFLARAKLSANAQTNNDSEKYWG